MSPADAAAELEVAEADARLEAERAALLAELRTVGEQLERVPQELRDRRLALYLRGRALNITFARLGEASGKSEPSVIQAVNKAPKAPHSSPIPPAPR